MNHLFREHIEKNEAIHTDMKYLQDVKWKNGIKKTCVEVSILFTKLKNIPVRNT